MKITRPAKLRIGLLAFLALCTAALLALELWCRFSAFGSLAFPPHLLVYDKQVGYHYNPAHSFTQGGLRGRIHVSAKQPGTIRIVCLGESSTSCDLIGDGSRTWPFLLQKYLYERREYSCCEVLNAAVGGFGSRHVRAQCMHQLPGFSPDIVIVYLGWNGRGVYGDRFRETPFNVYAPQDNPIERIDKVLLNHSYCYLNRIRWRVEPLLRRFQNHPESTQLKDSSYIPAGFFEDIVAIIDAITAQRAVPVVITFPVWTAKLDQRDRDSTDLVLLRERIRGLEPLARRKGAEALDLSGIFLPDSAHMARYFYDGVHMNTRGCEVFARALADSLARIMDRCEPPRGGQRSR